MTNFLLELMSEEMPASLIQDSAETIRQLLYNSFEKNDLTYDRHNVYYGPKRLTFLFINLRNSINEVSVKGPSLKASDDAIKGFARSHKITPDKLKIKKTKKGDYYFIQKKLPPLIQL